MDDETSPNLPPVIRTLVVDNYEPWRRFVCAKLQERPRLRVIGEATNGLEAVQRAQALRPHLIILSVALSVLNGIEAAHRISRLLPGAAILFLSTNNDAPVVEAALSNGARGYVHKMDAYRELLPAVEAVLRGEQFSSTSIAGGHAILALG